MIDHLLEAPDTFELVRDAIGAILLSEFENQKALAADAGKDPAPWSLKVCTERFDPWNGFALDEGALTVQPPIVHIAYDSDQYDPSASNAINRTKVDAIYHIDCYGYGIAEDVVGGGHKPGDREAIFEAHRAMRLTRQVLMASQHKYLGLKGIVWSRRVQARNVFRPTEGGAVVPRVVGGRIDLMVGLSEFSPLNTYPELSRIALSVKRRGDGELYFAANFDLTQEN